MQRYILKWKSTHERVTIYIYIILGQDLAKTFRGDLLYE